MLNNERFFKQLSTSFRLDLNRWIRKVRNDISPFSDTKYLRKHGEPKNYSSDKNQKIGHSTLKSLGLGGYHAENSKTAFCFSLNFTIFKQLLVSNEYTTTQRKVRNRQNCRVLFCNVLRAYEYDREASSLRLYEAH